MVIRLEMWIHLFSCSISHVREISAFLLSLLPALFEGPTGGKDGKADRLTPTKSGNLTLQDGA